MWQRISRLPIAVKAQDAIVLRFVKVGNKQHPWEFILLHAKPSMNKDRGVCKGLCKQYKVRKPRDGTSRYLSDQVRCQICGIFMTRDGCHDIEDKPATGETVGLYCNCCNCMVRSKPRNKPGTKDHEKDSGFAR